MTRLHGRSPKGERLVCHAPHGHWCTTTMISSVRLDGTTACMTIEGATNTEVFQAYVREVLVPSLRPGDIVVMDNLRAHKNELTLALIEQAGAEVRFFPAYSPDLNPTEMMWSKVKSLLRKAQARNHPDLLAAIASALNAVTPDDARRLAGRSFRLQFYLKCSNSTHGRIAYSFMLSGLRPLRYSILNKVVAIFG